MCMSIARFAALVFALTATAFHFTSSSQPAGTQTHLESIVKGRCLEFKYFVAVGKHKYFAVNVTCDDIWREFKAGFVKKDACALTENDYDGLFNLLKRKSSDKLLFWHETNELAHDVTSVTNYDYVTLEDTLTGYIADKLTWCGCVVGTAGCDADGINYNSCPANCSFGDFITTPFWIKASKNFAKTAKGTATVILDGAMDDPAYSSDSFFGRDELPFLGKQKQVQNLVALVAVDPTKKAKERCGEGSLKTLVNDAKKHGIRNVKCEDNPTVVFGILCAKYHDSAQCKSWRDSSDDDDEITDVMIVLIVLTCVFFVISVVLAFFFFSRYCRKMYDLTSPTERKKPSVEGNTIQNLGAL